VSTLPQIGDTKRQLWARILTKIGQSKGNTANAPLYTDPTRILLVKILKTLL
jgi:hypothetical protein